MIGAKDAGTFPLFPRRDGETTKRGKAGQGGGDGEESSPRPRPGLAAGSVSGLVNVSRARNSIIRTGREKGERRRPWTFGSSSSWRPSRIR